MGQRGTQIVIRGKRTLHKGAGFWVMETMPELWIVRVRMGTEVNGCCIGGGELLRKYERWLFGACAQPALNVRSRLFSPAATSNWFSSSKVGFPAELIGR